MPNQDNSSDTFYADAAKKFNNCARGIIESGQLESVQPLPADWMDKVHEQVTNLTEEEKSHIRAKTSEAVDYFIALAPQIIPGIEITKGNGWD